MTSSAPVFRQCCFLVLLLVCVYGFGGENQAQTQIETKEKVATAIADQNEAPLVDRGKLRLQLLISLVENERRAAIASKTQLTTEKGELERERTQLSELQTRSRPADKIRLEQIEQRLLALNKELAAVDARLPDLTQELGDLQRRLDEANGIEREVDATAVEEGPVEPQPNPSQWPDRNRQIQEALIYLGGYNALIDGDFGPRTRRAVEAYQQRQSFEPTGILTGEQETALLQEAEAWRLRYGMNVLVDEESGYRLTYPSSLLSEVAIGDPGARRMVTADGEGELLITVSNGAIDLVSMYTALLDQYQVQYRRKRDNWFVVAGLVDDKRIIYDTARQTQHGIIRARLIYPRAKRDLWLPFAVMMFNTFEAVPRGQG